MGDSGLRVWEIGNGTWALADNWFWAYWKDLVGIAKDNTINNIFKNYITEYHTLLDTTTTTKQTMTV